MKRTAVDPPTVPSSTTSAGPDDHVEKEVVGKAKIVTMGRIAPNRTSAARGTNGITKQRTLCVDCSGNFVPCSVLTRPSAPQPTPTMAR